MLIYPFAALTAKYKAGFGLKEASTTEALKHNTLPVLFIHGAADDFVPVWMTKNSYEACVSPKEMHLVEGAGHGQSYMTDKERCDKALKSFLGRCLEE